MNVTRIRRVLLTASLAIAGAAVVVAPNEASSVPSQVLSEHPFAGTTTTTDPVAEVHTPASHTSEVRR